MRAGIGTALAVKHQAQQQTGRERASDERLGQELHPEVPTACPEALGPTPQHRSPEPSGAGPRAGVRGLLRHTRVRRDGGSGAAGGARGDGRTSSSGVRLSRSPQQQQHSLAPHPHRAIFRRRPRLPCRASLRAPAPPARPGYSSGARPRPAAPSATVSPACTPPRSRNRLSRLAAVPSLPAAPRGLARPQPRLTAPCPLRAAAGPHMPRPAAAGLKARRASGAGSARQQPQVSGNGGAVAAPALGIPRGGSGCWWLRVGPCSRRGQLR